MLLWWYESSTGTVGWENGVKPVISSFKKSPFSYAFNQISWKKISQINVDSKNLPLYRQKCVTLKITKNFVVRQWVRMTTFPFERLEMLSVHPYVHLSWGWAATPFLISNDTILTQFLIIYMPNNPQSVLLVTEYFCCKFHLRIMPGPKDLARSFCQSNLSFKVVVFLNKKLFYF